MKKVLLAILLVVLVASMSLMLVACSDANDTDNYDMKDYLKSKDPADVQKFVNFLIDESESFAAELNYPTSTVCKLTQNKIYKNYAEDGFGNVVIIDCVGEETINYFGNAYYTDKNEKEEVPRTIEELKNFSSNTKWNAYSKNNAAEFKEQRKEFVNYNVVLNFPVNENQLLLSLLTYSETDKGFVYIDESLAVVYQFEKTGMKITITQKNGEENVTFAIKICDINKTSVTLPEGVDIVKK